MTPLNLQVLREYVTPNGWSFVPIHYSHDPEKGDVWFEKERAIYANQEDWDREQEIDFRLHLGTAAYPNFSRLLHVMDGPLPIFDHLPLGLCCDFNVSPMVWEVAQIVNGWQYNVAEIVLDPAKVDMMVVEFRNRWPAHPGGINVYGDATGKARTHQTAQSDYDLMRIAFRGYPTAISWSVPVDNPDEKDRRNAVNLKLKPAEGMPGKKIAPECKELIADYQEVVLRPDQKKIFKVYASKDPYSRRTHASDADGYMIWREWPVFSQASRMIPKAKRAVLKPMHLLGDINWGTVRRTS